MISDRRLYEMAEEARKNAYAPYSGFRVGAALLAADGRVFTGVNVENSSFGASVCAERTAIVKAVSEGAREFDAIAVSAGEKAAVPCGICRQFMAEFAPGLRVITGPAEREAGLQVRCLSDLLPDAFMFEDGGQDRLTGKDGK